MRLHFVKFVCVYQHLWSKEVQAILCALQSIDSLLHYLLYNSVSRIIAGNIQFQFGL